MEMESLSCASTASGGAAACVANGGGGSVLVVGLSSLIAGGLGRNCLCHGMPIMKNGVSGA